MSTTITQRQTLPLDKAAPVLASHVARVQARAGAVALQTGLAMAVPVIVAWLAIAMPLDWLVALPRWARALLLVAGLGGAGAVWWWFGIRGWRKKPGSDAVALAIERAVPEFRSRFIASVQLSRKPEESAHSLVKALVRDTTEFARTVTFENVIKTDGLRRWVGIAAGAVFVATLLWWLGGRASWPLLQRAWLHEVPVPRKTQITAFTGDRVIALGDDLRLEAATAGEIPAAGKLWLKTVGGKEQEFAFDADPLNRVRFFRTLQSVQDGFEYRVELGDNKTAPARVRVRPRPTILNLACEQRWPDYTKLPPQRRAPGELKLLAGSKLAVRLKPSAVLRAAQLRLVGGSQPLPLKEVALRAEAATPGQIAEWSGVVDIPAKDASGLAFALTDEEGVESKGMATYRIEIVPDQPPAFRLLWPARREELVTARATLLVAFEAKDDFGIGRVKLHYGINWTEGAAHRTLDLDLGGEEPKSLTRRFEWKLERLKPALREGDVVDFWFEVLDANNVTGPGVAVLPEHYQARVVSDLEKRADLANRLNDTLQGLNDVKTGQEELANRLGELIREKQP